MNADFHIKRGIKYHQTSLCYQAVHISIIAAVGLQQMNRLAVRHDPLRRHHLYKVPTEALLAETAMVLLVVAVEAWHRVGTYTHRTGIRVSTSSNSPFVEVHLIMVLSRSSLMAPVVDVVDTRRVGILKDHKTSIQMHEATEDLFRGVEAVPTGADILLLI